MELGFDHKDLQGSTDSPPSAAQIAAPLEWAGLRARFVAAHGLRREMAGAAPAGGSFMAASTDVLAGAREWSMPVNPNALANGKTPCPNDDFVSGIPHAGDRGNA